ncbi:5-formyltetrahydrofolate cyclo-ligase [Vibrio sp. SS-MA-C1-2]|uniref:5-formyltetrahydrofolate cyclo-ligase n=1 Tax=Vibrio sp. SS-MA-C1-2 TaxID=2908646 RepID=UPI001F2E0F7C|nr:5-formyltetrahydrofolate cyclo-ligase [Vibrio sp. SS-MA-C1-2]UJF19046.1 5-formyltetrahydrofolate cyclo-ligase [Vibrio sp. SS-MA-C1-2]
MTFSLEQVNPFIPPSSTPQTIRKLIRQQRRQLSSQQQQQASDLVLQRLQSSPNIKQAKHIAIYLSVDGELDTLPIITWLWQQNKQLYLPVLNPDKPNQLLFLHYTPATRLILNKYQILEPKLISDDIFPAEQLDIVITPLVAFSPKAERLGMGGGYYDRLLAPWLKNKSGAIPIGIAHNLQLIDSLPSEPWDVPLAEVMTPDKHWVW